MYFFIVVLILGFGSNIASTFTSFYSEQWGKQVGTFITILLRDIFGIPVWAAGFLLAIKESEKLIISDSVIVNLSAWILIIAGAAIIITALVSIRLKAAAPSANDALVDKGLYSVIRHPIHCGTFLEFSGLFLLWPSINVLIACLTGLVWIIIQSRLEERDLVKRIPGYRDYMKNVPRFIPFPRNKV
jgi:protein-S-isoprenylcysteine O-methyltransferase Ste14